MAGTVANSLIEKKDRKKSQRLRAEGEEADSNECSESIANPGLGI
jgi:hypothetical protein